MKNIAKIAVIGALLALGATHTNAQTNALVTINIGLTGVKQTNGTEVAKVHITNKDIIRAIVPDAASNAKLLLQFAIPGDAPVFIVRQVVDHTNLDTIVDSGVLTTATVGTPVDSSKTASSGVTTDKVTEIRRFVFNSDSGSFDVAGYTTSTSDNKGKAHGEILEETTPTSASAQVSGTGTDSAANPAVLKGTISLGGRKFEETTPTP